MSPQTPTVLLTFLAPVEAVGKEFQRQQVATRTPPDFFDSSEGRLEA